MLIHDYIAYLKDNPHGYWFKAKLYGWGWTPATTEGWLTLLIYIGLVLLLAFTVGERATGNEVFRRVLLPVALLTGILIAVCVKKGEKPRWMWGPPKIPRR